MWPVSKW